MSKPNTSLRLHGQSGSVVLAHIVLLGLLVQPAAGAEEPRKATAKCLSPAGTLLQRTDPEKAWQPVEPLDTVHSRDQLLALPGARAALKTSNGDVGLTLHGNLPQLSPYPVLESSVVLHDTSAADLDFTLDRGRVVVTNRKEKGSLRVRVRMRKQAWELTLQEPGCAVALELYGRWLPGVPFKRDSDKDYVPTSEVLLLVLKGEVDLKTGKQQFALRAPPGPAAYHWHSVRGEAAGPERLDKLPAWAEGKAGDKNEAKAIQEALDQLLARLKDKPVDTALTELLEAAAKDSDAARAGFARKLAVYGMGAIDDVPRLTDVLADPKRADVRQTAIEALRHWMGRDSGHDIRLYNLLIVRQKYSANHAEVVLQLLHNPFDRDQVETYEALVAYLLHERLPIRELAYWHLQRLVPEGLRVAFDPSAAEDQRKRAQGEWKKLIQDGKLPPK